MKRRRKGDTKELKVAFEVLAGRDGGRGIFAIEDAAEEVARRTELAHIAERIAGYDRGYTGNRRRCPQCGRWQQYKEERAREVVFDCGTVRVVRVYYFVCPACGHGKRASRAWKSKEVREVGNLPPGPFAFDFQGAFAGIVA